MQNKFRNAGGSIQYQDFQVLFHTAFPDIPLERATPHCSSCYGKGDSEKQSVLLAQEEDLLNEEGHTENK